MLEDDELKELYKGLLGKRQLTTNTLTANYPWEVRVNEVILNPFN
jgi:hypothetical protein